jgi:hypothetical protein
LAVDDHQIHFGMWNARRFDQVLHRDLSIEEAHDGHEAVLPRQEVVQLGVEAKLGALRTHLNGPGGKGQCHEIVRET